MRAELSNAVRRLNLSVPMNAYIQEQIDNADTEQADTIEEITEGLHTWEDGCGCYTTLRARKGSNDKAGTLYHSVDIEWIEGGE